MTITVSEFRRCCLDFLLTACLLLLFRVIVQNPSLCQPIVSLLSYYMSIYTFGIVNYDDRVYILDNAWYSSQNDSDIIVYTSN